MRRPLLDDRAAVHEHHAARDLARSGMTMIVVTHELGFAREVASRVVFMDRGAIVEEGPPQEILARPQHPRTREFIAAVLP